MNPQAQPGIAVIPESLTAILETKPGRRRGDRFLVIVDVRAETGRALDLVAAPQGINPLIKFLRIATSAAPAPGGAVVRRTLRYEEVPARADYKEVWLGEGDAAISAKVSLAM